MTIHKEGRFLVFITTIVLGLSLFLIDRFYPQWPLLFWAFALVGGFFWIAFLQFFRFTGLVPCCKYWVGKSNFTDVKVFFGICSRNFYSGKSFYGASFGMEEVCKS